MSFTHSINGYGSTKMEHRLGLTTRPPLSSTVRGRAPLLLPSYPGPGGRQNFQHKGPTLEVSKSPPVRMRWGRPVRSQRPKPR